jgi:hypothetical protein
MRLKRIQKKYRHPASLAQGQLYAAIIAGVAYTKWEERQADKSPITVIQISWEGKHDLH